MAGDLTQIQGGDERRRAQNLSLQRTHPPTQVPGYEPERFLGAGAYGEVWVAVDRNTGRRVAIKFYAHRGGLDWSLLAREVEKLAFLTADRYVVQLIEVGWDSDPPYYVMEYLERGSLEDRLQSGPMPVSEALRVFRDVAIGLVHAHGKGVLHCDLKPANVLLDQDWRPRLADFGQSRLTNEQSPALGTLFYMAPEQANLEAVPDARWDVYALGALFCCMLTGQPPHKSTEQVRQIESMDSLDKRLKHYREMIRKMPKTTGHRKVSGVDRALADIIERCLAVDPRRRFPNAQAVLDALDARAARRARQPLLVLGALGPALLLAIMSMFAWDAFTTSMARSTAALTDRALESDWFAAQFVAQAYARGIEQRYRAVQRAAEDPKFQQLIADTLADDGFHQLVKGLDDEALPEAQQELLRARHAAHPIEVWLHTQLLRNPNLPRAASWFISDTSGRQLGRAPLTGRTQIGSSYAKRDYFHGTGTDDPAGSPPMIQDTYRSIAFQSTSSYQWVVAFSTPIRHQGKDLGLLAMTVELGKFAELGREQEADDGGSPQVAVLVDARENSTSFGQFLQHPLLEQVRDLISNLPTEDREELDQMLKELGEVRVESRYLKQKGDKSTAPRRLTTEEYHDPLFEKLRAIRDSLFTRIRTIIADHPADKRQAIEKQLARLQLALESRTAPAMQRDNNLQWLAAFENVVVKGRTEVDTGWVVIVQEPYGVAVGPVEELRQRLVRTGVWAMTLAVIMITTLWGAVIVVVNGPERFKWLGKLRRRVGLPSDSITSGSGNTKGARDLSGSSPGPGSGSGSGSGGNSSGWGSSPRTSAETDAQDSSAEGSHRE